MLEMEYIVIWENFGCEVLLRECVEKGIWLDGELFGVFI